MMKTGDREHFFFATCDGEIIRQYYQLMLDGSVIDTATGVKATVSSLATTKEPGVIAVFIKEVE